MPPCPAFFLFLINFYIYLVYLFIHLLCVYKDACMPSHKCGSRRITVETVLSCWWVLGLKSARHLIRRCLFCFFEAGSSCVAQGSIELPMWPSLALNSQGYSFLSLPSAGFLGYNATPNLRTLCREIHFYAYRQIFWFRKQGSVLQRSFPCQCSVPPLC